GLAYFPDHRCCRRCRRLLGEEVFPPRDRPRQAHQQVKQGPV
ncbi:hypothetical protein, partial [Arthrobacter sp. DR-2P]